MNQINWKYPYFTIWAGQAVSLLTSAVLQMAIIWYLTDTTKSAAVLSWATLVGFLPQAVLGTMIGVLVDRWDRKLIMIGADLFIAAAGLSLAILSFRGEISIGMIFIVLFLRSVGTAFHSPAISAVTPLMVPTEELTKCAGYVQSIQSVSYILGPAIAAVVYAKWGLSGVIALDVLGAVIACLAVAFVTIPKQATQEKIQRGNFIQEMKAGYAVVKEQRVLVALLWMGALFMFIYMPINALFPLMSMDYFGGTTVHASIVEIVFAVGMLAGGLLLGVWGGFQKRAFSIVSAIGIMGIALFISGCLPKTAFSVFIPFCFLMGFSAPLYSGVEMALFQEKIDSAYLGRVFGLFGSLMSFTMPLGLVVCGLFADKVGVNWWFALSGIGILLIAVVTAMLPSIRNLDS